MAESRKGGSRIAIGGSLIAGERKAKI